MWEGGTSVSDLTKNLEGQILKTDEEQRLVYGWASVVTEKGELVVDRQGDMIEPETLVKAVNNFMEHVRVGKEMHKGGQIGAVIHSMPITKEIGESLGIQSDREGWIVPNLLKQIELEELSLVDRPANAQAMVSLYKRDNSSGEPMEQKIDEVSEDTTKAEALEVNPLEVEVDTLKADNERLRKSLIEAGYIIKSDIIEKKIEPEYVEYEGEQINKADIPAPILKALENAGIEKADIELTKRAEELLPHFNVTVAKTLVKSFAEDEAVMEALKASDKMFSETMKEFGKSDADGEFATSADKIDALVKSYMSENEMKKGDYAKAYAIVAKTDEGKALINKSYKGE